MRGFRHRRAHDFVAVCAVMVAVLGGCLLTWKRPLAQSMPAAESARPANRSAGVDVFAKWCSDCHSTESGPGSMALQRKYRGNLPAVLERRSDLRPEYVERVVRQGVSFMPSFRKTEISDADLAVLAAYLAPPK